jgi:hypothetical protein
MKILLGDSNAKVGREEVFKSSIGNESFHENSNDNVVNSSKFCHIQKSYRQKYDVPT